jgi:transposase
MSGGINHKEIAMDMRDKVVQIGLDVHRKFSAVSVRDEAGRILTRQRLDHVDRQKLRKTIASWPVGTPVMLEATFGWGWLSDELLTLKMDPHLASSRKVAAWREGRGLAKSNTIDADLLSELWSEKPTIKHGRMRRWWEVWLAPREVRDQRELLRHRMTLVRTQTRIKNAIHAMMHRHGILIEQSDLFGVAGRRMLQQLTTEEDGTLRETARRTLKDDLMLLDCLRRLIARLTRQFRATVRRSDMGRRLITLPGVSTILAYTIAAEIGRIDRFPVSRCLLRYSLLGPCADDSGEERSGKPIGRRLGHAGRKTLQWAWIEAAHGAVRKDKGLRENFNRRTDNGRKDRGRGYIKVANRMCRIAYSMMKKGADYQEDSPPRPGSRRSQEASSRPGTGQLSRDIGHKPEAIEA